ncbi:MAG: hypothetical protein LBJ46_01855 [Planctomycetota bacterium]|jgi:hypothetical protein|nr:hypothetical protein [Planctomycetota bacterium]
MLKKSLLLAGAAFMAAFACTAGDSAPKLLSEMPVPAVVPAPEDGAACPPPPPVASPPPAPDCPPAPPACPPAPAPAACPPALSDFKAVQVPVRTTVTEVVAVPVKKRVTVEECYVAHERRTGAYDEVKTRTARRTIEVPSTKMVSEAKMVEVASVSGKSVRLARGVSRSVVPTTRKEVEEFQETYTQPVRFTYTEAVPRTRKVTRYVEEYKTVARPTTVTTMETRMVRR